MRQCVYLSIRDNTLVLLITDVDLGQVKNFCSIAVLREWDLIAFGKLMISKIK